MRSLTSGFSILRLISTPYYLARNKKIRVFFAPLFFFVSTFDIRRSAWAEFPREAWRENMIVKKGDPQWIVFSKHFKTRVKSFALSLIVLLSFFGSPMTSAQTIGERIQQNIQKTTRPEVYKIIANLLAEENAIARSYLREVDGGVFAFRLQSEIFARLAYLKDVKLENFQPSDAEGKAIGIKPIREFLEDLLELEQISDPSAKKQIEKILSGVVPLRQLWKGYKTTEKKLHTLAVDLDLHIWKLRKSTDDLPQRMQDRVAQIVTQTFSEPSHEERARRTQEYIESVASARERAEQRGPDPEGRTPVTQIRKKLFELKTPTGATHALYEETLFIAVSDINDRRNATALVGNEMRKAQAQNPGIERVIFFMGENVNAETHPEFFGNRAAFLLSEEAGLGDTVPIKVYEEADGRLKKRLERKFSDSYQLVQEINAPGTAVVMGNMPQISNSFRGFVVLTRFTFVGAVLSISAHFQHKNLWGNSIFQPVLSGVSGSAQSAYLQYKYKELGMWFAHHTPIPGNPFKYDPSQKGWEWRVPYTETAIPIEGLIKYGLIVSPIYYGIVYIAKSFMGVYPNFFVTLFTEPMTAFNQFLAGPGLTSLKGIALEDPLVTAVGIYMAGAAARRPWDKDLIHKFAATDFILVSMIASSALIAGMPGSADMITQFEVFGRNITVEQISWGITIGGAMFLLSSSFEQSRDFVDSIGRFRESAATRIADAGRKVGEIVKPIFETTKEVSRYVRDKNQEPPMKMYPPVQDVSKSASSSLGPEQNESGGTRLGEVEMPRFGIRGINTFHNPCRALFAN